MNKKIKITFILIFTLFCINFKINNVKAEDEDNIVPPFMITEGLYEDGSLFEKIGPENYDEENGQNKYLETLKSYYENKYLGGETFDTIDWLAVCNYSTSADMEYPFATIYLKRKYFLIILDPVMTYNIKDYGIVTKFEINSLLDPYDESCACPETLFYTSKVTDNYSTLAVGVSLTQSDDPQTHYLQYYLMTSGEYGEYKKCNIENNDPPEEGEDPENPPEEPTEEQIIYSNKYESLCTTYEGVKQISKIVGYIIRVILWLVPLVIIIFGMIDFVKAMISKDDNAISGASTSLIRRLIIGIAVFFVPTIILSILRVIEITGGIEDQENSQFAVCTKCIFDPFNCQIEK